ncbi:olfactory receptor 14C36-like [Leptosomus discolor]
MSNASTITQFLLLPFADTRELQLLTFGLFLGIYLAALLANGLIITAVACEHRLHTPMYFFLLNLSLLDLGSLSTTLPKAMANALWNTRAISYTGCIAQLFTVVFFMAAEYFLLTVMAYDRYVAICKPLHYGTLLGSRACVHMAAAAWGTAFPYAVLHTANTFSLPLCQGNAVDQFFCEIPQILKLSCSDTYLREAGVIVVSVCSAFGCFVFIVVSYVQIFRAVLRIPSEQGRHKAFSTCLPHLVVVSLFLSTVMFAYLKPPSTSSPALGLVMAVLYSLLPPAVNPFIYSMRNQELKEAVWKLIQWYHSYEIGNGRCPSLWKGIWRDQGRMGTCHMPWGGAENEDSDSETPSKSHQSKPLNAGIQKQGLFNVVGASGDAAAVGRDLCCVAISFLLVVSVPSQVVPSPLGKVMVTERSLADCLQDKLPVFVNKRRKVDAIYLNFGKTLDTLCCSDLEDATFIVFVRDTSLGNSLLLPCYSLVAPIPQVCPARSLYALGRTENSMKQLDCLHKNAF